MNGNRRQLYALLLKEPGEHRRLSYRCGEHKEMLPSHLRGLPANSAVLLTGAPGRWDDGAHVGLTLWALQPSRKALRDGTLDRRTLRLQPTRDGVWSSDADGRACELGECNSPEYGPVGIINYAGWRLADLTGPDIEIFVSKISENCHYYVIPARSIDASWGASERHRHTVIGTSTAHLAAQAITPVDYVVMIDEIEFFDLVLRVRLPNGRSADISEPRSLRAFDAIKSDLRRHFPEGIRIVGATVEDEEDEECNLQVHDIETLDLIFKKAQPTAYLHQVVRKARWVPARER